MLTCEFGCECRGKGLCRVTQTQKDEIWSMNIDTNPKCESEPSGRSLSQKHNAKVKQAPWTVLLVKRNVPTGDHPDDINVEILIQHVVQQYFQRNIFGGLAHQDYATRQILFRNYTFFETDHADEWHSIFWSVRFGVILISVHWWWRKCESQRLRDIFNITINFIHTTGVN